MATWHRCGRDGTVAEAARQQCGSGTVPACFRWTIGALFSRSKREKPYGFCRVFDPRTAGAEAHFFWRRPRGGSQPGAFSAAVPGILLAAEGWIAATAFGR